MMLISLVFRKHHAWMLLLQRFNGRSLLISGKSLCQSAMVPSTLELTLPKERQTPTIRL